MTECSAMGWFYDTNIILRKKQNFVKFLAEGPGQHLQFRAGDFALRYAKRHLYLRSDVDGRRSVQGIKVQGLL